MTCQKRKNVFWITLGVGIGVILFISWFVSENTIDKRVEKHLKKREYPQALALLRDDTSGEYDQLFDEIKDLIHADYIVAGDDYVAALTRDGSMVLAYASEWEREITIPGSESGEISRLVKSRGCPLALNAEGSLLIPLEESPEVLEKELREYTDYAVKIGGTVSNSEWSTIETSKKIAGLTGIKNIYARYPGEAVAIFKDGTVEEIGPSDCHWEEDSANKREVESWRHIEEAAILYGSQIVAMEKAGGIHSVEMAYSWEGWENVITLEVGTASVFGLTTEGTVLSSNPKIVTDAMQGVISIAAGYDVDSNTDIVWGIRADGTVIDNEGNVQEGFEDIVALDISTLRGFAIGLKSDGTMYISDNADEQLKETVTSWKDLLVVDVGRGMR